MFSCTASLIHSVLLCILMIRGLRTMRVTALFSALFNSSLLRALDVLYSKILGLFNTERFLQQLCVFVL